MTALAQTEPELALHRIADKAGELHREGTVQTEITAQIVALFLGSVLPKDAGDRVADILEQHEGDEGHREHHDDSLKQAAKYENQHGRWTARQLTQKIGRPKAASRAY